MSGKTAPEFHSRLSAPAAALVLLWLPMHVAGLPLLLYKVFGVTDEVRLNFLTYAIGAVYLLAVGFRFLRRDFDVLCDRPGRIFFQILGCYGAMLLMNLAASGVILLVLGGVDNPNNAAVMDMVGEEYGTMSTIAVFLAPFVEEMCFRAGVFGTLRRKSRLLAYLGCILLFSVYHVWGYSLSDPLSWLYVLQYIPASFLLCRCYEYCDSIWGSLFFHMLTNFVSLQALSLVEELL